MSPSILNFAEVFLVVIVSCFVPMGILCWLVSSPCMGNRWLGRFSLLIGGAAWIYSLHGLIGDYREPKTFFEFAFRMILFGWSMSLFGYGSAFVFRGKI